MRLDVEAIYGRGNHFAAKISVLVILEHLAQRFESEEINAHRGEVRSTLSLFATEPKARGIYTHCGQLVGRRFLTKLDESSFIVRLQQAEARGVPLLGGNHR